MWKAAADSFRSCRIFAGIAKSTSTRHKARRRQKPDQRTTSRNERETCGHMEFEKEGKPRLRFFSHINHDRLHYGLITSILYTRGNEGSCRSLTMSPAPLRLSLSLYHFGIFFFNYVSRRSGPGGRWLRWTKYPHGTAFWRACWAFFFRVGNSSRQWPLGSVLAYLSHYRREDGFGGEGLFWNSANFAVHLGIAGTQTNCTGTRWSTRRS